MGFVLKTERSLQVKHGRRKEEAPPHLGLQVRSDPDHAPLRGHLESEADDASDPQQRLLTLTPATLTGRGGALRAEEPEEEADVEGPAHIVIQAVDVQDDGLGPLVAGAHEELRFAAAAADGLLRPRRGGAGGAGSQELVDLRGQQLGLPGGRGPGRQNQKSVNFLMVSVSIILLNWCLTMIPI